MVVESNAFASGSSHQWLEPCQMHLASVAAAMALAYYLVLLVAENLSFNIAALVVLSGPIDRVAAKARLAAPRVDVKSPGSAPRTGKISLKGNNVAGDPSTSTGRDEGVGSAKRAASAAKGSPPKKAKKEHAE